MLSWCWPVLLCLLHVYAERPSGSPTCAAGAASSSRSCTSFTPPFGSCGNLMALSHGSITHQHLSSHISTSRQGSGNGRSSSGGGDGLVQPPCSQVQGGNGSSSNRSTAGSSTQPAEEGQESRAAAAAAGVSDCQQQGRCGTAAPVSAAAPHNHTAGPGSTGRPEPATGISAAPSEQKLSIKNARFALSEDEAISPVKALTWDTGETSTTGSRLSSDAGASPAPAQGVRLIGAAVGRAAGGARGTTVCVAAVGRSDHTHDDEVRPYFSAPAHGKSLLIVY